MKGWPLLAVETDANGDSGWTYERGPSLAGLMGSSCSTSYFCPVLTALVGPIQHVYFPLRIQYFVNSLFPSPSKLHGQAVVSGRLSLNMCLWVSQRGTGASSNKGAMHEHGILSIFLLLGRGSLIL